MTFQNVEDLKIKQNRDTTALRCGDLTDDTEIRRAGQGLLSNEFRDDLDIFSMFEKPKTREVLGWAPLADTGSLGTKIKWDFYFCYKFAVSKLLL